ncbi:MAG TPA: LutB/LldF family L-lactate oxidation iron-sulfur protein [Blastocatellia bacterium]|nr:LutB/LldF family L-lactate oxidation iron-sulfur protein [Blastocatellia bacterium]
MRPAETTMKVTCDHFLDNVRAALADETLRRALRRATRNFSEKRQRALSEMPDWHELRQRAQEIKRHTLEHLDRYLEEFAERVVAAGGHVFWAPDGESACRYVVELARRHGVTLAVKGKSMLTEEISLNDALERAGITPVETDLGEYIVQLAHEPPSHIIAPAIHKSKEQVAELFRNALGTTVSDDIEELTRTARRTLREKFHRAGLGISGVNFAVAETGTIVLVENEGNIRLSTSLPEVHVALMGIEKVIPRWDDLAVFLRLLPRSATGQKMSAYVSLLTGPRRPDEPDGPDELHVVIVDNGRSAMLADPDLRQALACIHCGACLNVCPVYRTIGGHAYGWVYSGPIGAILTPQLVGLRQAGQLPFASSLCGACRDACPVGIDFPRLLLALRHRAIEGTPDQRPRPAWRERVGMALWAFVMMSERRYRLAATLARWAQKLFVADGRIRRLPLYPFSEWTKDRDLPPLAPQPFRKRWKDLSHRTEK